MRVARRRSASCTWWKPASPALQPLLKWCGQQGRYRVVEDADLQKASSHHEGVVADVIREEP
jgi:hypothetical protein